MADELTGRRIVGIRKMTEKEAAEEGWDISGHLASVIVLDDGTKIYASRDDEGNGIGTLFGRDKSGKAFYVTAREKLKKVM